MKQNLHTHTVYCDGNDTPEEMVQTAIAKKFDILGFSGHGHVDYDDYAMSLEDTEKYIREVNALKEKYRDQIHIYLGTEVDVLYRIPDKTPYDYMIGSVHCIEKDNTVFPVDYSKEVFEKYLQEWYNNDFIQLAEDYCAYYHTLKTWEEIDIIGHIDLITKYNEDESYIRFEDPSYVKIMTDAVDDLGNDRIFEVNTGAIARGTRRTPYPWFNLLCYMKEKGARIMLNSDCHSRDYLDCCYRESLEMIRKAGFTSMAVLTDNGFADMDIDQFTE